VWRSHRLLLLLILAIAFLLQFTDLAGKSLWSDEVVTVRIASQPDLASVLASYRETERQPPLHYLILHASIGLFGTSDLAVRVPSALLSVASVGVIYWLGINSVGRRAAGLAAFMLAVSPFALLFGRMARYFALSLFLALLATALFLSALRRERDGRPSSLIWGLYSVTALLMLLSNYVNATLYLAHVVFAIFESSGTRARRRWLWSQLPVLGGLTAWLVIDWSNISGFAATDKFLDVEGLSGLAVKLAYPFYAFGLGETVFPWRPLGLVGTIAFALLLPIGMFRLRRLGSSGRMLLLGLSTPLVGTWLAFGVITQDQPFVALPSRAIAALPFVLLIVAVALVTIPTRFYIAGLVALTATWIHADLNYYGGYQFHQPTYTLPKKEIVEEILAAARPSDLIVSDKDLDLDYYLPAAGPVLLTTREERALRASLATGRHERVWLVTLGRDRTEPFADDRRPLIEDHYQLAETRGYVRQDAVYRKVKLRLAGFGNYRHKITVRLFVAS
jgi:4-amino-4-deoxy-L-arabinose transferase-like glycosyltransferase